MDTFFNQKVLFMTKVSCHCFFSLILSVVKHVVFFPYQLMPLKFSDFGGCPVFKLFLQRPWLSDFPDQHFKKSSHKKLCLPPVLASIEKFVYMFSLSVYMVFVLSCFLYYNISLQSVTSL